MTGSPLLAALVALLLLQTGCERRESPPVAAGTTAPAAWSALVDEWLESDLRANPLFAFYSGRNEYAGVLPDWSEAGLAAELQRLHDWKARVTAVDPGLLDEDQRFEREALLAVVDGSLFWREAADWPHRNAEFYALNPSLYLDRPYADATRRLADYTRWAAAIPRATAQIAANIRGAKPRVFIDHALSTYGPMADFLDAEVPKVFAGIGDADAQAAFHEQNARAVKAFRDLQKHFESLRPTQTEDFALGPKLFAQMLFDNERVDTPLEALEAAGRADLERNRTALVAACAKLVPGRSIRECIAREEREKPAGSDMLALARTQLGQLRQFLVDHDVVAIPGEEQAEVRAAPPYNAQNFAYMDPSPPLHKELPAFYYLASPDPAWPRQKQLDYVPSRANLLFTSVHEIWPGHFLQFLHSNRTGSTIAKVYVGYAFAEGWAHYAEELMWDLGLGADEPTAHVGQLRQALLRNVRFLSAIGLHTQGMTVAQSRQMFLEAAYQDEGNAEQQAARGAYDPAYLNYTLGKLLIRRLRGDWCATRGGVDDRRCWKQFHDAFLSHGGPPIPLVRGAMMGEAPSSRF